VSARLPGPVPARVRGYARDRRGPGGVWIRQALRRQPDGSVDGVEWVDLPGRLDLDLPALEREYFDAWVPRVSAGLVGPRWSGGRADPLRIGPTPTGAWPPLIALGAAAASPDRWRREILGGLLAKPGGTLDFEVARGRGATRLVVAVRGLRPRLPHELYFRLQARLHVRSTFGFLREVARRRYHALGRASFERGGREQP